MYVLLNVVWALESVRVSTTVCATGSYTSVTSIGSPEAMLTFPVAA